MKSRLDISVELTDEEKESLKAEAKRQLQVELKKKLKAAYLEELLREHRIQDDPDSNTYESVLIDVAGHADGIRLDGKFYQHGTSFKFNAHQARTVREIMARTWEHEHTIGGANRDVYRAPQNRMVTPHGVF